MYDLPELRPATEAWWRGIAAWLKRLGEPEVPESLTFGVERHVQWRSPDLLLSQTCGFPLTHEFKGRLTLVATPCYRAEGCAGATYRSVILSHARTGVEGLAGLGGKRVAVNGFDSQSGWNILRHTLRQFGDIRSFVGEIVLSGSHRASVAAIQSGAADAAAIDCVSFELLRRHAPGEIADLRILAWSEAAPCLPYVARAGIDRKSLARLRDALQAAISDPRLEDARAQLLLDGFSVLALDAYDIILEQEQEVEAGATS